MHVADLARQQCAEPASWTMRSKAAAWLVCRSEAVCQPLPDFVTAERPAAYRPVPWREFMQARVAGV